MTGNIGFPILDAQLHCWHTLARPHWTQSHGRSSQEPYPVEQALAAMDAVGVTAALVHVLGADESRITEDAYSLDIAKRFPKRIATVAVLDPFRTDIETAMALAKRRGDLAVRTFFRNDQDEAAYDAGAFTAILQAARRSAMPVMIFAPGRPSLAGRIAAAHPDVLFIIDHLAMPQPPRHKRDNPPFLRLPELIALAAFSNLAVKLTGLPSCSDQPYPFDDLWSPLARIADAFGFDRLMWGSDMTRFWGLFAYSDLVDYMRRSPRLSHGEKAAVMGGTLARLLQWPDPMTTA